MIDTGAERGNQLQGRAGFLDQFRVELVGHGRDQDVRLGHGGLELIPGEWLVRHVQPRIEQLHHPGFHRIR